MNDAGLRVVTAAGLATDPAHKVGIHAEVILSLAFWGFLGGIAGGARLFYVTKYWHEFAGQSAVATVLSIINLTQGGLVVYGAIVGGTLTIILSAQTSTAGAGDGDIVAPSQRWAWGWDGWVFFEWLLFCAGVRSALGGAISGPQPSVLAARWNAAKSICMGSSFARSAAAGGDRKC